MLNMLRNIPRVSHSGQLQLITQHVSQNIPLIYQPQREEKNKNKDATVVAAARTTVHERNIPLPDAVRASSVPESDGLLVSTNDREAASL